MKPTGFVILLLAFSSAWASGKSVTYQNELEAAGVGHEMVTYGGAPHAFTVFDSPRYREDADKKSWKLFGEFLVEVSR